MHPGSNVYSIAKYSALAKPDPPPTPNRWLAYFENHSYDVDADWYSARLVKNTAALFRDVTSMRAIAFNRAGGSSGCVISPGKDGAISKAVEQLLEVVIPRNQNTFLNIQPSYSLTKLPICKEMLWHLISLLSIFPGVFDMLHLFGKTDEANEDYAVYRQHYTPGSDSGQHFGPKVGTFELCYNFKYVEQRISNASDRQMIWTTRKIGVYAKREPEESRTTWILIQPGVKSFMDRVTKRLQKAGMADVHDLEIHLLFMKSASQNWTDHISDLEIEFRELDTKAFLWRPEVTHTVEDEHLRAVDIPDSQRIQHFIVKLHQLSHSLEINCANIESLWRGMEEFKPLDGYFHDDQQYQKYDRELKGLHFRTMQHKVRVKNLLSCAEGLFSLVCTVVPYIFARRENSLLLRLSQKATEYAKSMKLIAIMCMAYLPPSLVAGVFSMMDLFRGRGFGTGPLFGVFLGVTVALFALTYGFWAFCVRIVRKA